jgi:hypothetical protein
MSRTYRDIKKYKTKRFWNDWMHNKYEPELKLVKYYRLEQSEFILDSFGYENVEKPLAPCIKLFLAKNKKIFKNINDLFYPNLSGAPSWWVRLTMTRRARRLTHTLEQKILISETNIDNVLFPLARKPFNYFY